MSADEIAALTLAEVVEGIRAGRLSSEEVTQASLDRFDRYGAKLHCIAGLDSDDALSQARQADRQLAEGRDIGPLHGVPLAHKDMFYRQGRISACGSIIRADFVPDTTATVLECLDGAGALDIARLNMVEFAYGPTGHNDVVGTPRNPWNTAFITGGSSSGPGASVAGRLVYGALGSDTGGSIRFPACCCGIVGMKATYGLVSRSGAMPLCFSLDHVGPLARTVEDCALMLQAIAGADPRDPTTSGRPVPDFRADLDLGVRGLRVAVPSESGWRDVHEEVRTLVETGAEELRRQGAEIVEVALPDLELSNVANAVILGTEAATCHRRWLEDRPDDYGPQTRERLRMGFLIPATRYVEALKLRAQVLAKFEQAVFERADALLLPVLPTPVPTIAESDVSANPEFVSYLMTFGRFARPFNYLGLPTLTVPCGFTGNGLPTAFQLVGRSFDEALLFRIGRAYERETDWTRRAPPL